MSGKIQNRKTLSITERIKRDYQALTPKQISNIRNFLAEFSKNNHHLREQLEFKRLLPNIRKRPNNRKSYIKKVVKK